MPQISTIVWSSVGKKVISAFTGLCLIGFSVVHLLGNLALLRGDPDPFNKYAHFLMSLGWLVYLAEIGLGLFFLFHIIMGIMVWLDKRKARPEKYESKKNAGGKSMMTISSKTMIYTGALLLIFLIVHLKTLKFGPAEAQGYITTIDGVEMRDLYRLTIESFSNGLYTLFYVVLMVLLGYHLRHGFWSAFQSLGVHHPKWTPVIYGVGIVIAIVLAAGFLFLPAWIYFKGGAV